MQGDHRPAARRAHRSMKEQQFSMHWDPNDVIDSSDECHLWFQTLVENVSFLLMRLF